MGRPINDGFPFFNMAPGIEIAPKSTVIYRVIWQTQVSVIHPMPFSDPAPGNKLEGYIVRNFSRSGAEFKVQILPKGVCYSAFTLEISGRQAPFRIDFTV